MQMQREPFACSPEESEMMKSLFRIACLSLSVAFLAAACGDDDEKDDGVSVDTPGADVDVKAKELQTDAAGSAASAPAQR